MDTKKTYDHKIAARILQYVPVFKESDEDGTDCLERLMNLLKTSIKTIPKMHVNTASDVVEFELNENHSELNIWHLHYNHDRNYLIAKISII